MLRENCGTPGVIILNNVHGGGICDDGEESSTDSPLSDGDETALDREDWNLINGPPSPCNIQFEGDNVVINGKSNLRKQPKDKKVNTVFFPLCFLYPRGRSACVLPYWHFSLSPRFYLRQWCTLFSYRSQCRETVQCFLFRSVFIHHLVTFFLSVMQAQF